MALSVGENTPAVIRVDDVRRVVFDAFVEWGIVAWHQASGQAFAGSVAFVRQGTRITVIAARFRRFGWIPTSLAATLRSDRVLAIIRLIAVRLDQTKLRRRILANTR